MASETPQDEWQDLPENHPLDGPRGKVVRGIQQALYLCRHCDSFAASNPIQLTARPDAEGHGQLVYLEGRHHLRLCVAALVAHCSTRRCFAATRRLGHVGRG